MKYLSDYMQDKQTDLFAETGTFFAFSSQQFKEKKKEGVKYSHLDGGMICPTKNIQTLLNGLNEIYQSSIKKDLEENGKDKIILRELYNHECFYTGSPEEIFEKLKDYNISETEILEIYRKNLH